MLRRIRNIFGQALLWAHIIAAAVMLGGSFYEMMVVGLVWSASLPESLSFMRDPRYSVDVGRFWGSLGGLPTLFLLGSLIFNWHSRGRRYLILVSFLCMVINTVTTIIYFVPALKVMWSPDGGGLSGEELTLMGNTWILGTWGRMALLLVSLIVSVWAMSISLPQPKDAASSPELRKDAVA